MADQLPPVVRQLAPFLVRRLGKIDPAWAYVIDRANRGGPGSSPEKPLYIAGWDPSGLVPRLPGRK